MKSTETPLDSNPPPPVQSNLQGQALDKDVMVLLTSEDKKACLPKKQPTSKRSKPRLGPKRQNDHKTLVDMKCTEKDDFNLQSVSKELVFKDCHVMMDDSSYADWLLSQGIDDSVQLPPVTEENIKPEEVIHKNQPEPAVHSAIESTDGQPQGDSEILMEQSAADLCKEYVTQFLDDLGSFIYSAESEQESMRHVGQLTNILFLMELKKPKVSTLVEVPQASKDVLATEPSTSDVNLNKVPPKAPCGEPGNEQNLKLDNKTQEEGDKINKELEGTPINPEEKKDVELDSTEKIADKEEIKNKDENMDAEKVQDVPVHKKDDNNSNIDTQVPDSKGEPSQEEEIHKNIDDSEVKEKEVSPKKEEEEIEKEELKCKRVSFDMVMLMKGDRSTDTVVDNNFVVQTSDGQSNGNESVNSDQTEILHDDDDDDDEPTLSQEMPLSQMPCKNPYIKDNVMDEGHLDDAKNGDVGNDDSNVEATDDIVLADDSEEYIDEEEEEGKETDSSS